MRGVVFIITHGLQAASRNIKATSYAEYRSSNWSVTIAGLIGAEPELDCTTPVQLSTETYR